MFSGILKKSNKAADEAPAQVRENFLVLLKIEVREAFFHVFTLRFQENLSVKSELSASSDSLSENNSNKVSGGVSIYLLR